MPAACHPRFCVDTILIVFELIMTRLTKQRVSSTWARIRHPTTIAPDAAYGHRGKTVLFIRSAGKRMRSTDGSQKQSGDCALNDPSRLIPTRKVSRLPDRARPQYLGLELVYRIGRVLVTSFLDILSK